MEKKLIVMDMKLINANNVKYFTFLGNRFVRFLLNCTGLENGYTNGLKEVRAMIKNGTRVNPEGLIQVPTKFLLTLKQKLLTPGLISRNEILQKQSIRFVELWEFIKTWIRKALTISPLFLVLIALSNAMDWLSRHKKLWILGERKSITLLPMPVIQITCTNSILSLHCISPGMVKLFRLIGLMSLPAMPISINLMQKTARTFLRLLSRTGSNSVSPAICKWTMKPLFVEDCITQEPLEGSCVFV